VADVRLWALAVYCGATIALVALVLVASNYLGERHRELATGDAFESGIVPVHRARLKMRAQFFIVAMLFVIFDVEAVYVLTWAVVARDVGWIGYIELAIFIGVLLATLAYLWRRGALDWSPRTPARRPRRHAPPEIA